VKGAVPITTNQVIQNAYQLLKAESKKVKQSNHLSGLSLIQKVL
jgi:hypothetical protein